MAVYIVIAIEIVFGGMLLAGYRLKVAARRIDRLVSHSGVYLA
jgi:hypothetical protein